MNTDHPSLQASASQAAPDPEDQARAGFYGLIAHVLSHAPAADLLAALANAPVLDADTRIAEARDLAAGWTALQQAAAQADPEALTDEFRQLFTGVGKPLVVLNGSWYLTGFLMEKPLAQLRDDLARLGLGRGEGSSESEDHLAAVCDAMRALILLGGAAEQDPLDQQRQFFNQHLRPWVGACCAALRDAEPAVFYRAVGQFAAAFFVLEARALDIDA